jgi:hypothetical protein
MARRPAGLGLVRDASAAKPPPFPPSARRRLVPTGERDLGPAPGAPLRSAVRYSAVRALKDVTNDIH